MDNKPASKGPGDLFVKVMRKQSSRAKERILEKLGKADTTQDELFDEYVTNISVQQNNVLRLQKEVKNYFACVNAIAAASKNLHTVVAELYEPEWIGQSEIPAVDEELQRLHSDRLKNLNDDLQNSMAQYLNQFPDAKTKVAKRNRKLVDYDGARHNYDAAVNNPKKNEIKIAKAQDELNACQKMYENLNDDLHRELPALYESRIGFFGHTLKLLWETEAIFHTESGRCFQKLFGSADKLSQERPGNYKYTPAVKDKRPTISGPVITTETIVSPSTETGIDIRKNENGHNMDVYFQVKSASPLSDTRSDNSVVAKHSASASEKSSSLETGRSNSVEAREAERTPSMRMYPQLPATPEPTIETRVIRTRNPSNSSSDRDNFSEAKEYHLTLEPTSPTKTTTSMTTTTTTTVVSPATEEKVEVHKVPTELPTVVRNADNVPERTERSPHEHVAKVAATSSYTGPVLYKVRATNPYVAEDRDELTFDSGDIILVIPYDNPEEQDEGWLMGVKNSDGLRGVFPANFTKPVTPS